jgi:RimJ/RimL family protein N-acetyltransferase
MSLYSISAERVVLRRFAEADLPTFLAYRNDPEVARYQSWRGMSEAEGRTFIREMREAQPGVRGEWFQFAIALKPTDALIGDCALQIKAEDGRQGEIGFTLGRTHQGQGLAAEAVTALLGYAFGDLHLHRIIAQVDVRNSRSIALLERLGLRREGHFLQSFWLKGGWIDEYLYALLSSEWVAQERGKG